MSHRFKYFIAPLTVIGQRLAAMNLLSPLAISDEFSTVRLQHNRAFTELLNAASSSLYPQVSGSVASTYTACLESVLINIFEQILYFDKPSLPPAVSKSDHCDYPRLGLQGLGTNAHNPSLR